MCWKLRQCIQWSSFPSPNFLPPIAIYPNTILIVQNSRCTKVKTFGKKTSIITTGSLFYYYCADKVTKLSKFDVQFRNKKKKKTLCLLEINPTRRVDVIYLRIFRVRLPEAKVPKGTFILLTFTEILCTIGKTKIIITKNKRSCSWLVSWCIWRLVSEKIFLIMQFIAINCINSIIFYHARTYVKTIQTIKQCRCVTHKI